MANEAVKAGKKTLDFTNVKERGMYNPVQQEEGDYLAKITSVMAQESKNGDEMWVFGFTLDGSATAVYPYYCLLNEDNLWKVRNLIQATGKTVPKKRVAFDPQTIVGKNVCITLIDDEYDGKMKSVINSIVSASELADTDDDEEEEAPAKKAPARRAPAAKAPAKKAPPSRRKAAPVEDDIEDDIEDEDEIDDDEDIEIDEL